MLRIAKYDCSVTVTISPESISRFVQRVIEDLNTFLERQLMECLLMYVKSTICQNTGVCEWVGVFGNAEISAVSG